MNDTTKAFSVLFSLFEYALKPLQSHLTVQDVTKINISVV